MNELLKTEFMTQIFIFRDRCEKGGFWFSSTILCDRICDDFNGGVLAGATAIAIPISLLVNAIMKEYIAKNNACKYINGLAKMLAGINWI